MSNNVRRICFYAGAGCGKSTLASKLFSSLKEKGHDVELVPEYIKNWAYEKRSPQSYDQLYVFAKQLKSEDRFLQNVNAIITDSPILMNICYSNLYGFECSDNLIDIALKFESKYPSLNFFIERTVDYVQKGRYQSHEESIKMDKIIYDFVNSKLNDENKLIRVNVNNFDEIINKAIEVLNDK